MIDGMPRCLLAWAPSPSPLPMLRSLGIASVMSPWRCYKAIAYLPKGRVLERPLLNVGPNVVCNFLHTDGLKRNKCPGGADAGVGIGMWWVAGSPLTELKIQDFHFMFFERC